MGYNNERVYGECEDRDSRPIIPLRETPAVKAGRAGPRSASMGGGGSLAPTLSVRRREEDESPWGDQYPWPRSQRFGGPNGSMRGFENGPCTEGTSVRRWAALSSTMIA